MITRIVFASNQMTKPERDDNENVWILVANIMQHTCWSRTFVLEEVLFAEATAFEIKRKQNR